MKNKILFSLTATLFIYFTYGLFLSQYRLNIIDDQLLADHPENFYDYSGVVNVHSSLSTGSETYSTILKSAEISGLDFVYFTDHNLFNPPKEFEGYHNSVLAFVGGEYSYLNSRLLNIGATTNRHLLGIGRSQFIFADLLSQENIDPDIGGFILAHPLKPGYEWHGQTPPGLMGVEVINLKEIWRTAFVTKPFSFLWTLLLYPFNPELAFIRLFDTPKKTMSYWDQINTEQPIFGFAGADAEAHIKTPMGNFVRFPSYQVLFNIMRNHVLLPSELTGNSKADQEKISRALLSGQFYWSLDIMANPKGFLTTVETPDGRSHLMGKSLKWQPKMKLKVHLPQLPKVPFETTVYKNGSPFVLSNSQDSEFNIHSPGSYRVVVRVIPTFPLPDGKKWIEWIYTNPFYITPP
ncbi:hypothetical protein OAQ84_01255 [Bdellovibrionales bacterium]|nr:hypothetical protein [Bdellovibrionales bacterium]